MCVKFDKIPGANLSGVYLIKRKSDGKPYVGQSVNIAERFKQHVNNQKVDEGSGSIDAAIKKEGIDNFEFKVIESFPEATTEQLWYLERKYIEYYNSRENGFNKTIGNHANQNADSLYTDRSKYKVSMELTKRIENKIKTKLINKRVLLIGNFNLRFVDHLNYVDCEVIVIDKYDENELLKYFKEELENMKNNNNNKFDVVISNPPYGKIGCEITKAIIDNVEYNEFVNLLPANDYHKKLKSEKLYQYVDLDSMEYVNNGFNDATVTTHLALINKDRHLYISEDEFEIENFIDPSLNKYFYANNKISFAPFDDAPGTGVLAKNAGVWDINKTFIIGSRDIGHHHLPYSKDCLSYKWNKEKSIKMNEIIATKNCKGQLNFSNINFNTKIERDNFTKFVYSKDGFRFMSKLFTAINIDFGVRAKLFPKVDWTKEWTVEKILKEFGYSKKEIKEVINDLVNFEYIK